ncbi:histidine protein methyltransferase 1 homolog isoform X1 [Uranotaenia lowii]|uniref:histidine protein methyltransferase 1 homolog isoform X1 n=1 Tax=Uranotaenia lowii TaxID=190385 RepID=UPI002479291A|nr:histidine protein methyltransferase 1 homolog isoform X1 [Uranotaenia lowii]
MFSFSFNVSENSQDDSEDATALAAQGSSIDEFECIELKIPEGLRKGFSIDPEDLHVFLASVNMQVEYINCLTIPKEDLSQEILDAEIDHSDLIPGRYEGGLKVWECTFDLGELMAENEEYQKFFANRAVLDLGCGSGILGILAVKLGAKNVDFQDYNNDVIENVTMKNYSINCCGDDTEAGEYQAKTDVRFFAGSWSSFTDHVDVLQYDVIVTSETIYSNKSYDQLIRLFNTKLKPDGVVLLAAKTYYFGVGGGLRQFEQALIDCRTLSYRVIWANVSGVAREILEIRRIIAQQAEETDAGDQTVLLPTAMTNGKAEGTEEAGAELDAVGQEATGQEAVGQEAVGLEQAEQEAKVQDSVHLEKAHGDATEQGLAGQEAARQEAAGQEAVGD